MPQDTGLSRSTIDKYYTAPDIVKECINLVTEHAPVKSGDLCIEPSAGNGSFIESIKRLFNEHLFIDIQPEHGEINQMDYLAMEHPEKREDRKIYVIGNPPFGRQSSLAIKFIKKSAEFCDIISFILPKSFKKQSLQKHFPKDFHLLHEYDIPDNSFIVDGDEYDVPCVFQIWSKKDFNRETPEKLIPIGYKFVKKTEEHDISFRRVGVYAGNIDYETENKSFQSHYFIKFNKPLSDTKFKTLASIKYPSKENTVGPKSISKQELIEEFNKVFHRYNTR